MLSIYHSATHQDRAHSLPLCLKEHILLNTVNKKWTRFALFVRTFFDYAKQLLKSFWKYEGNFVKYVTSLEKSNLTENN